MRNYIITTWKYKGWTISAIFQILFRPCHQKNNFITYKKLLMFKLFLTYIFCFIVEEGIGCRWNLIAETKYLNFDIQISYYISLKFPTLGFILWRNIYLLFSNSKYLCINRYILQGHWSVKSNCVKSISNWEFLIETSVINVRDKNNSINSNCTETKKLK